MTRFQSNLVLAALIIQAISIILLITVHALADADYMNAAVVPLGFSVGITLGNWVTYRWRRV